MSISLSQLNNIINARSDRYYTENYTYRNLVVTASVSSFRRRHFRIIIGSANISTNQSNHFYIRVSIDDFPMLAFAMPGENFNTAWVVIQYSTNIQGTYNFYGGIYYTGAVIVDNANNEYGNRYAYIQFWQPQLAQGNTMQNFKFTFVGFA